MKGGACKRLVLRVYGEIEHEFVFFVVVMNVGVEESMDFLQ
jgi:hypothetical protein